MERQMGEISTSLAEVIKHISGHMPPDYPALETDQLAGPRKDMGGLPRSQAYSAGQQEHEIEDTAYTMAQARAVILDESSEAAWNLKYWAEQIE